MVRRGNGSLLRHGLYGRVQRVLVLGGIVGGGAEQLLLLLLDHADLLLDLRQAVVVVASRTGGVIVVDCARQFAVRGTDGTRRRWQIVVVLVQVGGLDGVAVPVLLRLMVVLVVHYVAVHDRVVSAADQLLLLLLLGRRRGGRGGGDVILVDASIVGVLPQQFLHLPGLEHFFVVI